ncbi:DUF7619 domain-containing protein [Hymenobacter latericus]|uniref:DUF7619 domain-containing protein n=1 Tax=Hymenobacter sp. YIM 151858-1 TaxID=2987688 RepID=UPI0022274BC8|nr:IPT/TIG domain-containing protein [Hymenobacter sp. YIM 151858-1]UYZ58854.1 IPT/TIG domain-containing protein [Hymenobacter sp. YIM 151858-1]
MQKLLLALALLLGALPGLAQFGPAYRFEKLMGTPIDGPFDVATDGRGYVYVLNRGDVEKLDSTGRHLATIALRTSTGQAVYGSCLGADAAGNLYVGSYRSTGTIIRKYDPAGQLVLEFGGPGSGPGQFEQIESLCVDAVGNVYAIDSYTQRVQSFDPNGRLRFAYKAANLPYNGGLTDVDVDASGALYVLRQDFAIIKLSAATGQLLSEFPLGAPSGSPWVSYYRTSHLLVTARGELVVSGSQMQAMRFSATGQYLTALAGPYDFTSSTRTALARGRGGRMYATVFTHQVLSDHLYQLEADGRVVRRWGNLARYSHVRQDESGNVYIVEEFGGKVRKYNAAGELVLEFGSQGTGDGQFSQYIGGFAVDALGNIYVLETSDSQSRLQKFDARGRFVSKITSFGPGGGYVRFSGLAVDAAGNLYIADYYGGTVRKLSAQGLPLGTIATRGTGNGQVLAPKAVAVDLRGNVYVADYDGRRVQKFDPAGRLLKQYGPSYPWPGNPTVTVCEADLDVDGRGNVYLVSSVHGGIIYAADGSAERPMPAYGSRVSVSRDGSRLLSMIYANDVVRFYAAGQRPPHNLLSGQLYYDANNNCVFDAGEEPLPGIAVVAEPGDYYGLTDESGHYFMAVDTGRYTVRPLLPVGEVGRTITPLPCAPQTPVVFRSYGNATSGINFAHHVSTAPYLRVEVASDRRRRCFRNTTTVSYANSGFAAAPNAAVTVALPPEVVLVRASAPYTRDAAGRYVFALGTLPANAGGSIVIQDSVACNNPEVRGRTVCTRAWITPANTYPAPPNWVKASVAITGQVQAGNTARFVLRNAGPGAMPDSLSFRVFQNGALALQHRYRLGARDSLVLRVPASRPVVRLEADQPAGHPTQRVASATVELRGLSTPGQPNEAMHSLPPNDPGPEVAESCLPILDSFDPNDKLVFPTGVTAQHYTPTNTPLRYRVRFQNTGTDDAYRVEVVDTLGADLDLSTLRVTGASHPYRWRLSGHGRPVLTFTLANLSLPPAQRDEPGSNGFVEFEVQPRAGLAPKTLVENFADIYFDYNPPVRTNTTTNRIFDVPLVPEPAVALAYPAVVAAPAVLAVTPAQGKAGTVVTLAGERFAPTPAANQVHFGSTPAVVLSASATSLTVRVPAGAQTAPVAVTTPDGQGLSAQSFVVYQPPTITSVAPPEGQPGALVTLAGAHFAPLAALDTVWFGGVPAMVQQASATELRVVVPAGAPHQSVVRLGTLGGTASSAQPFAVWYPPTIDAVGPGKGRAGDVLTLSGSNFAPAGRTRVYVGGAAASVLQASPASLQVRVPGGAQSGPVRVETPGGTATSAASFVFVPAPLITDVQPRQGTVGERVTLTARHLRADAQPDTVWLGQLAAPVVASTPGTLVVQVPRGARTGAFVVGGSGGRSNASPAFEVRALSPDEAIALYPNPTHGTATLDWHRADFDLGELRVYNAVGALVLSRQLGHETTPALELNLAAQRPGLYLLVLQTARGRVLKRLTRY